MAKPSHALVAILVFTTAISCQRRDSIADKITLLEDSDKELEAAKAAALTELPLFWRRFSEPKSNDKHFCVKVALTDQNGTEYFWLTDIKRTSNTVVGVIDQKAQIVKNIQLNQHVEVSQDKIIDWLFMSNGKMKGNFTLRPLMKRMSREDLQQLLPTLDANPSIRNGA